MPYLSRLIIYPIKSARGVEVDDVRVDLIGPVGDRRWMLVDDSGVALTQRAQPRMALIAPLFEGEHLTVRAPGMPMLQIQSWCGEGEWMRVRLWDDELRLPHPSAEYSGWFSAFLGCSCKLVHLPDTVVRPIQPPFDREPWRVSLADAFPLLVIGQASLDLLNRKLKTPVTMERFRPNLVIAGAEPHEEDNWAQFRFGEVQMKSAKLCARCAIPLVDPLTAETGVEPLRTMAEYRTFQSTGKSSKIMFGQNAVVTASGLLRVGEAVHIEGKDMQSAFECR